MKESIGILKELLKKMVENEIKSTINTYSFNKKITWHYEEFKTSDCQILNLIVVFVDRADKDDYGFVISFRIMDNGTFSDVISHLVRTDGIFIMLDKMFNLKSPDSIKSLENTMYEYRGVSSLLIKEYILDSANS